LANKSTKLVNYLACLADGKLEEEVEDTISKQLSDIMQLLSVYIAFLLEMESTQFNRWHGSKYCGHLWRHLNKKLYCRVLLKTIVIMMLLEWDD